ncbi:hypothetical protein TCAL_07948 [Tigriopus californicus]|uniref:OPA3-like protein n=1 Tax=Tigriopus californicus TaxID=6832 RepID=A0A553NC91_TIGCA|nr:putative OPA3-like protein CG13603 [Tigriopus californicus]TRY63060.1 hypothetical protein TCAL_07948 [Tigriopus californicus]|eukprot:TCALIF_07948-PA protein Name:"Similar to CG13601 Putative OPA3-like protein CG13603 (Drosophila melanogaster)" AED:0.18 eAED:0.19 QI:0/-1/0/1/-1/1/1/0/264
MAVGAFPLAKLGLLLIKQISKPIANGIARRAKASRIFRTYVCIPTAQLFHWYDVKVRMRLLNLGKATVIPKLNEEKAIETGSQLLSEMIILGIASTVLIFEYNRSSEKEEAKQEQIEREKAYLVDKVENLELTLEKQTVEIKELRRLTHHLSDEVYKKSLRAKLGLTTAPEPDSKKGQHSTLPVEQVSYCMTSAPCQEEEDDIDAVKPLVLAVADSFVGPSTSSLSSEMDDSYRVHYMFSPVVTPGLVSSAVDYFLDGCPGEDN